MVAYEQYDKKSNAQIKPNLELTEKRKAQVYVSRSNSRNLNQLHKSIEEKFNSSSINKTYAFPRKDDKQAFLTESAF